MCPRSDEDFWTVLQFRCWVEFERGVSGVVLVLSGMVDTDPVDVVSPLWSDVA